jgi:hypothetical protein
MVDECKSADVGVGATIAPKSHPEKGIIADLVKPQKTSSMTAGSTGSPIRPRATKSESSTVPYMKPSQAMASAKASPPNKFIHKALHEL